MIPDDRFGRHVHDIRGAARLLAVGDVQSNADSLLELLERAGYASVEAGAVRWRGGDAALLFVGDLVDRGIQPAEVLIAVTDLHEQARAAGGRLILVTGNHDDVMLSTLLGEGDRQSRARDQWFSNGGLETLARLAAYGGRAISERLLATLFTALFSDLTELEEEIGALCDVVREHFARELALLRDEMRPVALVNGAVLAFHAAPNLRAASLRQFIADAADEEHVLWDRTWTAEFEAGRVDDFVAKAMALRANLESAEDSVSVRHVVFGHSRVARFEVPGFHGKLCRVGRLVAPEPERGVPGVYSLLTTPRDAPQGGAMGGLEFTDTSIRAVYGQTVVCASGELAPVEDLGPGESAFAVME